MRNTSQAYLKEFRDELKELPNGTEFSHLLHKPSETSHSKTIPPLPLVPRSVQCRIKVKLFSMPLSPSVHDLQELGQEFIDEIAPNSQQKCDIGKQLICKQAACVGMKKGTVD